MSKKEASGFSGLKSLWIYWIIKALLKKQCYKWEDSRLLKVVNISLDMENYI